MTATSGADRPTLREQPEHVVFTAIQQASWARGVAMLDSDVAAFAKRVLEDLLPVMERAKDDAAADAATVIELLKRTAGDPDLWSAEERRAVMRLAALRSQGGGR